MADAAQERDPDVVAYGSFTGLRNDVTPERFSSGDLAVACNVDIDKTGKITRRDGYTSVLPGAAHSLWSNPQSTLALFAFAGELCQLNPDYSYTSLAPLTDATAKLSYATVNGLVYYSNGVDTGIIGRAAARSWGVVPPVLPSVQETVGSLPHGKLQFTLTYVREDGQESGAPLAGLIHVEDGAGLLFTVPVSSDPDVAAKNLYVSAPDGEILYLAQTMPNAQTQAYYLNDTTELDLPLDTQFLQPAPAGQKVAVYRGRAYVAAGDVLYPSEAFAYEQFDLRNYIPLDGRITMLAPVADKEMFDSGKNSGLFIGTDTSCGVLIGSSPEDFQYIRKTSYGAVDGALAYVDGALYGDNSLGARELPMWLSTQGICIGMPDMTIQNLTRTKFGFTVGSQGAAIFMPGPNRFIANSNS